MPLTRILRYLTGNKFAIDEMARDKSAIWYGLFFVLIAGVAREYDQESLFHRPDLFLAPLLASIPLALLYYGYLKIKHLPKGHPSGLRSFFGLFWMTAPLALFYAIPVEYLFSPLTALKVNTALLALVASWRVLLFARVMSLTLKQPFWLILVEIIWGGSVLVTVASAVFSFSLTEVMGGTVHSQETAFKAKVAEVTMLTTFWLGLVCFFIQFIKGKERSGFAEQDHASPRRWTIPIALIVVAIAALVLRQPALYRSAKLDRLIAHADSVSEGLDYMAQHAREDFAHTWPLPPAARSEPLRLWRTTNMLDALKPAHPPWITEEILGYLDAFLTASPYPGHYYSRGSVISLIGKLPDTQAVDQVLKRHSEALQKEFDQSSPHYLRQDNLDELQNAEIRLNRAGVTVSIEELVINEFETIYTTDYEWKSYSAKHAMNLVIQLPDTTTARQWIREHTDTLSALRTFAAYEDELKPTWNVYIERLERAGIPTAKPENP